MITGAKQQYCEVQTVVILWFKSATWDETGRDYATGMRGENGGRNLHKRLLMHICTWVHLCTWGGHGSGGGAGLSLIVGLETEKSTEP